MKLQNITHARGHTSSDGVGGGFSHLYKATAVEINKKWNEVNQRLHQAVVISGKPSRSSAQHGHHSKDVSRETEHKDVAPDRNTTNSLSNGDARDDEMPKTRFTPTPKEQALKLCRHLAPLAIFTSARGSAEVSLGHTPFQISSSSGHQALIGSPRLTTNQTEYSLKLLQGVDLVAAIIQQQSAAAIFIRISQIVVCPKKSAGHDTTTGLQERRQDDGGEEAMAMDEEIAVIPIEESRSIWGGPNFTWPISSSTTSGELMFQLVIDDEKAHQEEKMRHRKVLGSSRVSMRSLLDCPTLNLWVDFLEGGQSDKKTSAKPTVLGKIQVRLTPFILASLHSQQTCETFSPGPSLAPQKRTSYSTRKLALYSCSPVILNVYDVSLSEKIQQLNQCTKAMGVGGIFHGAIEVFGKEYSFGGTCQPLAKKKTGIFACSPKKCTMHHYRESIYLGDCELLPSQVEKLLKELRPKWLAHSYNLFHKNCCSFSEEFAIELGVGKLPAWVNSLAHTAEDLEPHLVRLNQYLTHQAHTQQEEQHQQKNRRPKTSIKNQTSARNNALPVPCHHEAFLDHAMAARIQRSVRRHATLRQLKK